MEAVRRLSSRLSVVPISLLWSSASVFAISSASDTTSSSSTTPRIPVSTRKCFSSGSSAAAEGWFGGLGGGYKKSKLPSVVRAGDPVLHERAVEVEEEEMKSEQVQKIIDDMIRVMRKSPGVGLAAPQIGIPMRIIVLEDKEEYIRLDKKEDTDAQDRKPFDLLVIINPNLKKTSDRTALFFEGCLSVRGFLAVVERYLDVEVSGFDRRGKPIRIIASGWQARILQHECDHLDGYLYVDKMVPRTFRTIENCDLPLACGCGKLGPRHPANAAFRV